MKDPCRRVEWLRHRLSVDCQVDVYFYGPVTVAAIENLIKHLELGKDVYPEEASDAGAEQDRQDAETKR